MWAGDRIGLIYVHITVKMDWTQKHHIYLIKMNGQMPINVYFSILWLFEFDPNRSAHLRIGCSIITQVTLCFAFHNEVNSNVMTNECIEMCAEGQKLAISQLSRNKTGILMSIFMSLIMSTGRFYLLWVYFWDNNKQENKNKSKSNITT